MWKVQPGGEDMIKCIQGLEETGRFPQSIPRSRSVQTCNMQKKLNSSRCVKEFGFAQETRALSPN